MTEKHMDSTTDCPSLGTLRAHLDHDAPDVAAHLDGCQDCRETIMTLADRAGAARRLLTTLDGTPPIAIGAAPASSQVRAAGSGPVGRHDPARPAATRRKRLRERVGLVGGAAVLTVLGATVGQPVIAQALDSFRSEQVRPVVVEPGAVIEELRALEDIADVSDIGGASMSGDLDDLDAAAALAQVPAPDLSAVRDALAARVEATSAVGARIAFRATSDVPERLRGVVVEIVAPGAMVVGDHEGELVIAVARAVEVTATGASLDDVRDTLLREVDLPAALRDQLAAMDDWRTALPIPVPVDASLWDEVTVAGAPGLAIGHGDAFGAVVWQDGDIVRAIGGRRGVDELLGLAGGL